MEILMEILLMKGPFSNPANGPSLTQLTGDASPTTRTTAHKIQHTSTESTVAQSTKG